MANKRIPDNVHLLQGTHRKDRHGTPDKKAKLKTKLPVMPKWLPARAKTEWKRITKVLAKSGLLTEADQAVLAQYCLLYGELAEWKEDFPAAKHTQLRLCQVELGLTPSARSKITVVKDDEEEF